jgi:hypothetical protein
MNTKLVGISRTRTEQLYSQRVLIECKPGIVQNIGMKGVWREEGKEEGGALRDRELRAVVERV